VLHPPARPVVRPAEKPLWCLCIATYAKAGHPIEDQALLSVTLPSLIETITPSMDNYSFALYLGTQVDEVWDSPTQRSEILSRVHALTDPGILLPALLPSVFFAHLLYSPCLPSDARPSFGRSIRSNYVLLRSARHPADSSHCSWHGGQGASLLAQPKPLRHSVRYISTHLFLNMSHSFVVILMVSSSYKYNALIAQAYADGCDYMYQYSDDAWFISPGKLRLVAPVYSLLSDNLVLDWPRTFAKRMEQNGGFGTIVCGGSYQILVFLFRAACL
jgi:hypothetical protein